MPCLRHSIALLSILERHVGPIVAGRLESQFGNGSSNQNAYILIYKRKDVNENPIYEDIPVYWKEEIEKQNENAAKEREAYEFEKNHLEIYLQPQVLFNIQPGAELKYVDQKDSEEQGVKIKFTFDTTVGEVKDMIRKELSLGEGTQFDGFEACAMSNQLCQVFRALSDYKDDLLIKDTEITHCSTWLISADSEIQTFLQSVKGMEKEPIYINFKHKEEEKRTIWYRDMLCSDFLEAVAKEYGYESWKQIKCTYYVDGLMRRIDRLKYDVEKQCDHTLKSLKVGDNAQVVIDPKTEDEIKAEEENASKLQADFIDPDSQTQASTTCQEIVVDETENIRSVLMHKEEDPEYLERFNIDLDWTVEQLLNKIKQFMGILKDEERRLRREYDSSLIYQEELQTKLRQYEEFVEGGVRLKLEYGRFPYIEELALTVALYGNNDLRLRFYFKKDTTISEGKEKICGEFGLDQRKYRLWRTDIYDDPQYIVKKERQVWEKNCIGNGDFLILKNEEDILPDEQVIIDIHETKTGIPNDCQSIGHVKVKETDTIDELKEAILDMEEYKDKTELANLETDKVRLRARSRNLFFGRVFREKNKTLKQLKVKSGVHLVVQFLDEPENLKNNEILLLVRKRDIKNMDYHEFIEFIYNHEKALPTIEHLREKLGELYNLKAENIDVAKYIPHCYDWKYWNPDDDIEVKQKNKGKKGKGKGKGKNKNKDDDDKEDKKENVQTQKLAKCDLRSTPFLLSEGDILGVRDNTEEGADTDDFQTAADIQNRERLEELKKLDKETKGQMGKKQNLNNDPFKIYTDF